jgi:hypothetical protein
MILLFNILQLKNFTTRSNLKKAETKFETTINEIVPSNSKNFISKIIIITKRFSILHLNKILIIFLFLSSLSSNNVVGGIYFILMLSISPLPW